MTKEKFVFINDVIKFTMMSCQGGKYINTAHPFLYCILVGIILAELEPNHKLFSMSREEGMLVLTMMANERRKDSLKFLNEEFKT